MVDEPSRYEWDRLIQTMDAGFAGVHGRLDDIVKAQLAAAVQAQDHERRLVVLEKGPVRPASEPSPKRESALMAFALVAGAAVLKIGELLFSGAAHAVVSAFTSGHVR